MDKQASKARKSQYINLIVVTHLCWQGTGNHLSNSTIWPRSEAQLLERS